MAYGEAEVSGAPEEAPALEVAAAFGSLLAGSFSIEADNIQHHKVKKNNQHDVRAVLSHVLRSQGPEKTSGSRLESLRLAVFGLVGRSSKSSKNVAKFGGKPHR